MDFRTANWSSDRKQIRECVIELQDFERRIDARMPRGETIADAYLEDMRRKAAEHDGQVIVADDGEVIAGYVTVLAKVISTDIDDGNLEFAYIDDLLVRERFRSHGVGKRLLETAEHYARSRGARWLRLSVLERNSAATRLYEALGYSALYVGYEKDLKTGE